MVIDCRLLHAGGTVWVRKGHWVGADSSSEVQDCTFSRPLLVYSVTKQDAVQFLLQYNNFYCPIVLFHFAQSQTKGHLSTYKQR